MWVETLDSHLLQTHGINGIPLSYVVRDETTVQPHASDPSTNYGTTKLELVHRCPHGTIEYEEDNKIVWGILQRSLSTHISYSSIRRHSRLENGRQAYLDLQQHFCGRLRQENILAKVEGDIHSTYYFEDKANFTFETYISIHRNAYNEMDKAASYPTPDGGTRVRQLLANITTRDTGLAAAMASIRANSTLRNDFEDTVDILCQAVRSSHRTTSSTRRISSFHRDTTNKGRSKSHKHPRKGGNNHGGKHRNNKGGNHQHNNSTTVEGRFYSKQDYAALSQDQKKELIALRKNRSNNNDTSPPQNISTVSIDKFIQDKVEAALATIKTNVISSVGTESTSNATNAALQRNSIRHNDKNL